MRITLITPSLNGGAYLRQALASVRRQADADLEHVLIDGGSSDDTTDITREFATTRLVEAKGSSSHAAMNIGVGLARGEVIGFLNTDDVLAVGALDDVRRRLGGTPEAAAVMGAAAFFSAAHGAPRARVLLRPPSHNDMLAGMAFLATGFNAWFFRRATIEQLGGFNDAFDYSADRDFLLRLAQTLPFTQTASVLYGYRMHDGSRTMNEQAKSIRVWVREHFRQAQRMIESGDPDLRKLGRRFLAFEQARAALYDVRAGAPLKSTAAFAAHLAAHPSSTGHLIDGLALRRRLYRLYLEREPDMDLRALFPDLY